MSIRTIAGLVALVFASTTAGAAWAHGVRGHVRSHFHGHSHARVGVAIGVPLAGAAYWGWRPYGYWGPPPAVYRPYGVYAPPVVAAPPVYIERQDVVQGLAPGYWYWCAEPQGYHPAVADCPGGWQAVAPQSSTTQ